MRVLLLDSPPEVEQFAAWLDEIGEYESVIARDVGHALELLDDGGIEAVILAVGFGDEEDLADILGHCEPGNPSVLAVVDQLSDLDSLARIDSAAVEDFVTRPLTRAGLEARLAFIHRRRENILLPRQALLAALPDLMFRVRRDGTYIDYHFPSPEQTYIPGKELEGAQITDVMPQEVAEASLRAFAEVLDSGEPRLLEYQLPSIEDIHSYEARIVPSGRDEVLSIVRDVTERKRMEEALREAAKVKAAFTSAVVSAQEAERQQLSRELHDGVGQVLLVHRMEAEWLASEAPEGPVREAAEAMCASLDRTLETVRNMAMDLRPPAIDDLGIGSAIETLVHTLGRRSGIEYDVKISNDIGYLNSDVSVALYRITQEALANAIRHAQCGAIRVSLIRNEDTLDLEVRDDGIGFDPEKTDSTRCMGLVSMRERAELVGGRVTIESSAAQGTCVKVSVATYRTILGSERRGS